MSFDFAKYHALGNDYIVIDPRKTAFAPTPRRIRLLCDRHRGIGGDGILFGPPAKGKTLRVRIFNPDGGEAEKSGNGVRIFAKYLFEQGYCGRNVAIETLGGTVYVRIKDKKAGIISANLGKVTFLSSAIAATGPEREMVNEKLSFCGDILLATCLSVGNPHCVILSDTISRAVATEIGPILENHKLFPDKINVQFVKVLDKKNLRIEIWERGAGYTLASGSSACASAAAAHRLGRCGSKVTVHMPGGKVRVGLSAGNASICGPVSAVSTGYFAPELRELLKKV